ncbi:MAG TPA: hypothetical protein VGY56_10725 [Verrucomicrobiae bacterium]|nr:hypothetical protein [Verrucomicrobiae bacterium]
MPSATQFWLAPNKAAWRTAVNDLLTNQPIAVPTGCALQFNLLFTDGPLSDSNLVQLSNYTAIWLVVMASDFSETYIAMEIANANFQTTTVEEFQAFAAAQLQVFIPAAQNTLTASGSQGNFILQIYGVDADGAADPDILCQFQINAYNTAILQNPGSPLPTKAGTKLSFVCSWDLMTRDFTLVKLPNGQVSYTISQPYNGPGQAVYSLQLNGGLFYDLSLVQDSGEISLSIGQNGHS